MCSNHANDASSQDAAKKNGNMSFHSELSLFKFSAGAEPFLYFFNPGDDVR